MTETHRKELVACLRFELAAHEKGAIISKPNTDFVRYDYILDWRGRLYRVQVKYAGGESHSTTGCAIVNLRKRNRDNYTELEIDTLILYIPQIDKICWLGPEVFSGKTSLAIRYADRKINCKTEVLWACDHVW